MMKQRARRLTICLLCAQATLANGEQWELDGKIQTGVWSSDRALNDRSGVFPATLALRGKTFINDNLKIAADGVVGFKDYFGDENKFAFTREFYLDYRQANGFLRIGKQIIAWGRADQINPTDSLTSHNYQWLSSQENDQRFGNTGIRYEHTLKEYSISGVWLPFMRSSHIPMPPEYMQYIQIVQPDNRDNFALKLDRSANGLDSSLSFYSGIDSMPSLEWVPNSWLQLQLVNHRIRRYGGDFALATGAYTVRGEVAYTQTSREANEFSGKKWDYVKAVIGVERQFADDLNVNLQWVWQSQYAWQNANSWGIPQYSLLSRFQQVINQQPARDFGGIAYRVSKRFLNETVEFELGGIGLTAAQGWLINPRLRYQLTNAVTMTVGGDYYEGNDNTMLGRLKNNKTLFFEINYAFSTSG